MEKISIILVNHNGVEFLLSCIDSIKRLSDLEELAGKFEFDVILVDNDSKDGSIELLDSIFRNQKKNIFRIIKTGRNIGFAAAANLGAKSSTGDYLLFFNPDAEMGIEGFGTFIGICRNADQGHNAGIVGPKITNEDGTLQFSCRSFPTLSRQFYESFFLHRIFKRSRIFGSYFMTYWDHGKTMEVDWLSGACFLVKKEIFNASGGFDQDYFMYSEDTDLCLRLKRKGFKNYYFSDYEVKHFDGGIAKKNTALRLAQIWNSRRLYFLKNHSVCHSKTESLLYFIFMINRIIAFSLMIPFKAEKLSLKKRLTDHCEALKLYFSGSLF